VESSFASPFWITIKQAQELGAHVHKSEKGKRPPRAPLCPIGGSRTGQTDKGLALRADTEVCDLCKRGGSEKLLRSCGFFCILSNKVCNTLRRVR
jgi:hypothetical protein